MIPSEVKGEWGLTWLCFRTGDVVTVRFVFLCSAVQ
jgi:hypothetical protein